MLTVLALSLGAFSMLSFLGWFYFTALTVSRWPVFQTLEETLVVVAGCWAWASFFWLALTFKEPETEPLQRWVVVGCMLGFILVGVSFATNGWPLHLGSWAEITRGVHTALLFGGAPVLFSAVAMARHLLIRKQFRATYP